MVKGAAVLMLVAALAALAGVALASALGRPGMREGAVALSPVERYQLGRDVIGEKMAAEQRARAAHAVNNRRRADARLRETAAHPGHRLLMPREPARAEERRRLEAFAAESRAIDAALDRQLAELDAMERAYRGQFVDAGHEAARDAAAVTLPLPPVLPSVTPAALPVAPAGPAGKEKRLLPGEAGAVGSGAAREEERMPRL